MLAPPLRLPKGLTVLRFFWFFASFFFLFEFALFSVFGWTRQTGTGVAA
jgi:hypothetical protein